MDFSHYSDDSVRLATELVNTLDVVEDDDRLSDPAAVDVFLDRYGGRWCRPAWSPEESDLHEVRALRSRLRDVFESPDEEIAAERINSLLADVVAVPRVSVHGDAPHLHFEPENGSPAKWLGAIAAMGLGVALIEGGFDRFGVCAASSCEDVFVDTSRNRSRKHCSETCTTRQAVAAHRRRSAAEKAGR